MNTSDRQRFLFQKQNAKVLSGLAIRGGSVGRAEKDIVNWLNKLGMIK